MIYYDRSLKIGEVYRYASTLNTSSEYVDGLKNFLFYTAGASKKPLMESGINPIASIQLEGTKLVPGILISSSVHKQGSKTTPWQDEFDVDQGFASYFGDNKSNMDPSESAGNKALLDQFSLHNAGNRKLRLLASPILLFRSIEHEGKFKGRRLFQGVALIDKVERVSQFQRDRGYFTNYRFEFLVLNMSAENDELDWRWINSRRDSNMNIEESLKFAPESWKSWVENGDKTVHNLRRKVLKNFSVPKSDQIPIKNSREAKCLDSIIKHYSRNKYKFEFLAMKVTGSIISRNGGHFKEGWVTRGSGDGGIDFVGRVDLGSGFSRVKILILGQAKCEKTSIATSGLHIARTVARLKRGWIGAYVTTSHFSEPLQRELIEDKYPLLTVNGLELSKEVLILAEKYGASTVEEYLDMIDKEESAVRFVNPERILEG